MISFRGAVAVALPAVLLAACGGPPHAAIRERATDGPEAESVLARRLVVGFERMPARSDATRIETACGVALVRRIDVLSLVVFEARGNVAAARRKLLAQAGVAFVEGELLAPGDRPTLSRRPPALPLFDAGDPDRPEQWYLDKIGAPKAWAAAGNLAPVTVAVIDTGVDLTHPELQGRLVPGYNAAVPGQPPQDMDGHGTSTAGCIAAIANNGVGIAGVAPNALIMPVKVGWAASTIAESMVWAADHADMITMSLSVKPASSEYPAAVETFRRATEYVMSRNVPMVCSMGNTGSESRNVPSAFAGQEVPGLVAVGATDSSDKVTKFSTRGKWITLAAPGSSIYTLDKGGGYTWAHGTSFSTPITAGVVAMLLGRGFPKSPVAIKARLTATATDIDSAGFDDRSGAGRLDAGRAVSFLERVY